MNLLPKISHITTTELVTGGPDTPVSEARELFLDGRFHHLPVVEGNGILAGLFSTSDLLQTEGDAEATVGDYMTRSLTRLEPGDTVRTAGDLFGYDRFHALPVVEAGRLIGIVTTLNLIQLMNQEKIDLSDYASA